MVECKAPLLPKYVVIAETIGLLCARAAAWVSGQSSQRLLCSQIRPPTKCVYVCVVCHYSTVDWNQIGSAELARTVHTNVCSGMSDKMVTYL